MRVRMLDFPLATMILWIWVGFVVVLVAGWWMVKWWKLRHPPPKPEPALPYSQQLHKRLNEHRPSQRTGHRSQGHRQHGK